MLKEACLSVLGEGSLPSFFPIIVLERGGECTFQSEGWNWQRVVCAALGHINETDLTLLAQFP